MRFRSFIWISTFALVILMLVQYYFITETFKTKQEQFDNKYRSLSKLALFEFENKYYDYLQDSIFNILDDQAYFSLHDIGFAITNNEEDSIKILITNEFRRQLNQSNVKEQYLESYFKKAGEIADFKTKYLLREISLLSFDDEIEIFTDSIKNENSEILSSGYILNSYTVERNFYRIKYDYYISFSKRSEEIKNEMRLTKSLSLVTLLIVFAVFFLTLRNLFIQKRLSELKSDFINNMTHELKTPLSTISVATSNLILNEGNLDKEQVIEISGIIKKQNKHLSNLIDKILDIGIWEKDQVRINTKPLNIWQLINEIANDFRTANPGVSFELKLDPPKIEKLFSIDEVHFTTVINNLLSNALKYGGDPPVIQLIVEYGNLLEIKVTDNGKGIPLSEQKQLFEKFFRGKDSTERAIRGLGLGLYYVRQIVQAHNGQVYLEQSDENGSTFVISIMD